MAHGDGAYFVEFAHGVTLSRLPSSIKYSGRSGKSAGSFGIVALGSKSYYRGKTEANGASDGPGETAMPTPIETVSAFCATFVEDGGRPAVRRWFTPTTRWVNEGVSVTTGADEAIAMIDGLETSLGISTVHIDMLAIAADGSRVLTERLDRFERADGSEIGRVMIMGIFELEGDKIVEWRDYFDVTAVQKFSAG
jgi:limonene-1,2-epoxide hydrolase